MYIDPPTKVKPYNQAPIRFASVLARSPTLLQGIYQVIHLINRDPSVPWVAKVAKVPWNMYGVIFGTTNGELRY